MGVSGLPSVVVLLDVGIQEKSENVAVDGYATLLEEADRQVVRQAGDFD